MDSLDLTGQVGMLRSEMEALRVEMAADALRYEALEKKASRLWRSLGAAGPATQDVGEAAAAAAAAEVAASSVFRSDIFTSSEEVIPRPSKATRDAGTSTRPACGCVAVPDWACTGTPWRSCRYEGWNVPGALETSGARLVGFWICNRSRNGDE